MYQCINPLSATVFSHYKNWVHIVASGIERVMVGITLLAFTGLPVCYTHTGALVNGQVLAVECGEPVSGRYLVIWIPDTGILTLCEVKVIGYGKPFLSFFFNI